MLISETIKEYADKHYSEYSNMYSRLLDVMYDDNELSLRMCPICGGVAKLVFQNPSDGQCNYITAHIACSNCGIRTTSRTVDGYYGDTHTVNDVIRYWNHRPAFDGKKTKALNLSQEQKLKYSFWRDNHECKLRRDGIRYVGAIGGADTFHIKNTRLGEIVEVECACGAKFDLTEDF